MSKFGTKCRSRKMGIIRGTEEGRNLSVFPLGVQTKSCNNKREKQEDNDARTGERSLWRGRDFCVFERKKAQIWRMTIRIMIIDLYIFEAKLEDRDQIPTQLLRSL